MAPPSLSRSALALLCCGLVAASSCHDDDDLEGASRDLGELSAGGLTLTMTAELEGRYRRAHGGGGRLSCNYATGQELWTTRVALAAADEQLPLALLMRVSESVDDRDDAIETLEAMTVEQCPGPHDSVVFRVTGWGESGWRIFYGRPGHGVTGALPSTADSCAAAAAEAPPQVAYLTGVWEAGARAWVDLATLRQTRPGAGMDGDMRARQRDGGLACEQLLRFGDARGAIMCGLALRAWGSQWAGEPIVAAIGRGPAGDLDAEAALFALAAPGGLPAHPDPAIEAIVQEHLPSTISSYFAAAPTESRRTAFFDANVERCTAPPFRCEPWRMAALAELATEDDTGARCDRMRRGALAIANDEASDAAIALSIVKATHDCGGDPSMQAVMLAGLSRATLDRDNEEQRSRCRSMSGFTGSGALCHSLPRHAGEWLRRHCSPAAVERAVAVLEAVPNAEATIVDGPVDGAARVLAGCDRAALDRYVEARNNTNLGAMTADY